MLQAPDVQRRIAFYFGRLQCLDRLASLHFDLTAGIATVIGGVERTRELLGEYIVLRAGELLSETRDLLSQLRYLQMEMGET